MKQSKLNLKLSLAAAEGNAGVCTVLVGHGADPNAPDKNDHTALCHAALNGRSDCVLALIECGAKPNFDARKSPTTLELAAKGGCVQTLNFMLFKLMDEGLGLCLLPYAMDAAAKSDRVEIVKALIDAGANPNKPCRESGNTPLHTALLAGHFSCAEAMAESKHFKVMPDIANDNNLTVHQLTAGSIGKSIANRKQARKNDSLMARLDSFHSSRRDNRAMLLSKTGWSNANLT